MTRAKIAGGAFATVLVLLAVAAGYRALNQDVHPAEPPQHLVAQLAGAGGVLQVRNHHLDRPARTAGAPAVSAGPQGCLATLPPRGAGELSPAAEC